MSDPLSIAASITGLIALGQAVIHITHDYSTSISFEYREETIALEQEIKCLVGVLGAIKSVVEQPGGSTRI